jgi:hypothetical protein
MPALDLALHQNLTRLLPGEPLRGTLRWTLAKPEKHLLIRLIWFTEGESAPNRQTVAEHTLDTPPLQGEQAFEFTLPDGPHAFTGELISLKWAVEALAPKNKTDTLLEFTLSPTGEPLQLPATLPDDPRAGLPPVFPR